MPDASLPTGTQPVGPGATAVRPAGRHAGLDVGLDVGLDTGADEVDGTPIDDVVQMLTRRVGESRWTVDLSELRWVTPAMMVSIAALAHRARMHGTLVRLYAPVARDPARYAARMRLGEVLEQLGSEHDLPSTSERDQRGNLLEVTAVRASADAERLAELVYTKVAPRDHALAGALHRSIGEIGINVADHAATVGFVAAQTRPRRRQLMVAVADAGLGLRHTLRHRGAIDDAHAIELAVSTATSQFDGPDRGSGLPSTLRVVQTLGGSLYLASGLASTEHRGGTRRQLRSPTAFPGTIVAATIPLDHPDAPTPNK